MNEISKQLLQAVDIVVDKKISQLAYDKTVKAIITKVVEVDTGEYKVQYSGNIFSAYSNDINKVYKVKDQVYVKIPEGDFSNRKIITGLVSAQSLSSNEMTSLQNTIFEVSPEFEDLYGGNIYGTEPYGVVAGAPQNDQSYGYKYIYKGPETYQGDSYNGLFQQYANNYDLIKVEANFYTQLQNVHTVGNYGLEIEFFTKGDVVSYRLDLNSFNGDPYRLKASSPQYIVLRIQKNYLIGLKSIKLFQEDFKFDRIIENGLVTDKENKTIPNIFVEKVSLKFAELKDLSDSEYYLTIATPRGTVLTAPNILALDLQGNFIFQNNNIINNEKCQCKWFSRDLSIKVGHADYDKNAGFSWKPLGITTSKITINYSDVIYQQKYKLVVIYNEKIVTSAEVEIINRDNSNLYDYSITQKTIDKDIILQLTNKIDGVNLVGDWYISNPDSSYLPLDQKKNQIVVNDYLQYSSVVFYCAVYDSDKSRYVGTLEHTIISSESSDDLSISYIGEDTFRYDANGDIAIEDAEKERTLQVSLTWKEGYGTAYTVEWLMRDSNGNEVNLNNYNGIQRYSPQLSMIDALWVDNYNILHYNIKQKYKVNSENNTLIVRIRTISQQGYLFQKEILFLKDGDQGTNGTTYVVAIRPRKNDYTRDSGFKPLLYNNGWNNFLQLRCFVYKDGNLINDISDYTITYKWSGVNIDYTNDTRADCMLVMGSQRINLNNSATTQCYAKVQVSIKDNINNRSIQIYASYPIDILVGSADLSLVNIDSVPSYIKYNSSGLSPQFYSNNIAVKYNNIPIANSSIVSLNPNILQTDDNNKEKLLYLKPASSFIFEKVNEDNESNVGVLKIQLTSSSYILHSIIMYLDNYGNEAINGWDGTALEIDNNGQYIFAPQIGAGEKDSLNRFTGVVMGADSGQTTSSGRYRIGLYGYQNGTNTFGLMEDGTAFFGASGGGGRITINGNEATITGGDGGNNSNGMTIHLANLSSSGEAIKIGGGTFLVNYDGSLTSTKGKIANWNIEQYKLSSGSGNNTVALSSDPSQPYRFWAGKSSGGSSYSIDSSGKIIDISNPAPFVVTKDGFVYMTNAKIKGIIEAKEGDIGGWTIASNKLYSTKTSGNVGMASSGNAAFWAGANLSEDTGSITVDETNTKFLVTRSGKLYCSNVDIAGKITSSSGTIGGWTINDNRISTTNDYGESVYIHSNGSIRLGNNFSVSSSGNVTMSGNITATGGTIGGWSINNNGLYNGNVYLYSNGNMRMGDNFYISNGNVTMSGSVTATSGTIGGWTISGNNLVSSGAILTPNGLLFNEYGVYRGLVMQNGSIDITTNSLGSISLNAGKGEYINFTGAIADFTGMGTVDFTNVDVKGLDIDTVAKFG